MNLWSPINRIVRFLGVTTCFVLIGALGACYDSGEPYPRKMERNAKIEVKVESGGKIYSGYAIRNYQFSAASGMFSDTDDFDERGEAVVVKVGDKGYLFLLVNLGAGFFAEDNSPRSALSKITSRNETFDLLRLGYAPFVTFTNINDPLSVKEVKAVDYSYVKDAIDENGRYLRNENGGLKQVTITEKSNLKEFFGNDAKLVSISITPTNEPVTWGQVEKVIPWIVDGVKNKNLFDADEKNYPNGPPYNALSVVFFIRGKSQ